MICDTVLRMWSMPLVVMCGIIVVTGCQHERESEYKVTSPAEMPATADEVINAMIAAYQQAESYSDNAFVRLRYRQDGQWVEDDGKLSVKWTAPNKLQLRAYQLTMTSDGRQLRAVVADEASRDIDNQILQFDVAESLTIDSLFSDELVKSVIASGMGGPPVQLELLMADRPLGSVLSGDVRRELMTDGKIFGRPCRRVRVHMPEGQLVFWIDRQTHALRRLEYPSTLMAEQMAAAGCTAVSLTAEFQNCRFNESIDDAEFQMAVPSSAKLVRRFVLPPEPMPTDLFGRTPPAFEFRDLASRPVTSRSMRGAVTVLVWFNDHPACRESLQQIERVRAIMPDVSFFAVCTEPTAVSNQKLEKLADQWKLQMPLVRDLQAYGRDVFHIPWAPTLIVLSTDGRVQVFETGANPQLAEQLPPVLERLQRGEDVASEIVEHAEQVRQRYEEALAEATVDGADETWRDSRAPTAAALK